MTPTVAHMGHEIAQQADVVAGVLARRVGIQRAIRTLLCSRLRGVILTGRGSSENAAWFGRQALQSALHCPVVVVDPDLVVQSGGDYPGFAVIGISQSGETSAVVDAVASMRRRLAPTIAVTNDPTSALAGASEVVVDLDAGIELAVPATKTFTATLAALLVIADEFATVPWLDALPTALAYVISDGRRAVGASEPFAELDGWACIGEGLLEPISREAALKLEESALVVADHHDPASFHHGPFATAGPHRPALVLAGRVDDDAWRLAGELRAAGSPVVVSAPSASAELPLPILPDQLLAVAVAIRAQQFALALAVRRGINPDNPPRLTKVTTA